MLPSELTNTIEQFIVYVQRNEVLYISPTFMYHTNEFEAENIDKNPPLNVISELVLRFLSVMHVFISLMYLYS